MMRGSGHYRHASRACSSRKGRVRSTGVSYLCCQSGTVPESRSNLVLERQWLPWNATGMRLSNHPRIGQALEGVMKNQSLRGRVRVCGV